ncbi:MAG: hypothetical protein NVV59_14460 [Chitinophagaceae bacterium]|nr:hypothetical protein [Chitinophagaceae bacterium]
MKKIPEESTPDREPRSAETMAEEYERKRSKQVASMRSLMDYAIGVIIVTIGAFLFFRNQFDIDFNKQFPPNDSDKIIGGIFFIYGLWRIYRGYKKNYFK